MLNFSINNLKLEVKQDMSVLDACTYIGLHISRFCFHDSLSIAGNCRMCLVEIFDQQKPIASCVQPITKDLDIYTNTVLVKKAKENVLELLLLNHPLDCPVCEQGGECDLQDHSLNYGSSTSRFFVNKRAVEKKDFGFFIETVMNRCIHCTRCIRYFSETTDNEIFGTLFRGVSSQIGNLKNNSNFKFELFGNVIDLCPVGALNSKHYSTITKRPWELKILQSVDVTDSTGSNIYVHTKNNIITRILPKINKFVNGNFISDKTRFSFDGNNINRILQPVVKNNSSKKYTSYEIIDCLSVSLSKKNVLNTFFVDNSIDLASLNSFKKLSFFFGESISIQSTSNNVNKMNFNISFLSNKIIDLDNEKSKFCFIFGVNTRFESVLLNLKIRRKSIINDFQIFTLGLNFKNTFSFKIINLNRKIFIKFFESKIIFLCKYMTFFKSPIILISDNLITRGWNINYLILTFKKIIPTGIIIHIKEGSNSTSLSLLNIKSLNKSFLVKSSLYCALNIKESLKSYKYFSVINKDKNLIRFLFQTHYFNTLFKTNFIIPTVSEFESEQIYLNLEERPQKTSSSVSYNSEKILSIDNLISYVIYFTCSYLFWVKNDRNLSNNILKEGNSQKFIMELLNSNIKFQEITNIFSHLSLNEYFNINRKNLISFYSINSNNNNYMCNTTTSKNSLIMNEYSIKNKVTTFNFTKS